MIQTNDYRGLGPPSPLSLPPGMYHPYLTGMLYYIRCSFATGG